MRISTHLVRPLLVTLALSSFVPIGAMAADPKSKNAEATKPAASTAGKPAAPAGLPPPAAVPKNALPVPGGLSGGDFAQIQKMNELKQLKNANDALRNNGFGAPPSPADIANPANAGLSRPQDRYGQFGTSRGPSNAKQGPSSDPFGGVPQPTLPNNQDHAPRGSTSPRGTTPSLGGIGKGLNRQVDAALDYWSGSPVQEDQTSRAHGGIDRRQGNLRGHDDDTTQRPNGSLTADRVIYYRDGTRQTIHHEESLNADGSVRDVTVTKFPDGHSEKFVVPSRPVSTGGGNPAGTQDGDSYSGGGTGTGCNPFTGVCFGKKPHNPNQVNPGHDNGNAAVGASAVPFDRRKLVINPNPDATGGGEKPVLRDSTNPVNEVNPPGPRGGGSPKP